MAIVKITESILEDIADAIREKKNTNNKITPANMATEIASIQSGGSSPSSSSSYQISYPTDLVNQTLTISDISTNSSSYGVRTYNLANARIILRPNTGYRAGTILVDGVNTNSQEITLTSHQNTVITVTEAIVKPVTGYIMDGTMHVGKYIDDSNMADRDIIYLGFTTEQSNICIPNVFIYENIYLGSAINTDIEYTQYGSTTTDRLTDLFFGFIVEKGTTTMATNNFLGNDIYESDSGHQSTWILHVGDINGTEGDDYFTFTANSYNHFFNNDSGLVSNLEYQQSFLEYLLYANTNDIAVPIRISELTS